MGYAFVLMWNNGTPYVLICNGKKLIAIKALHVWDDKSIYIYVLPLNVTSKNIFELLTASNNS